MWQRIKRVFRSFANFFISVAEDPELILEQNIRDLNAQVPKMNEAISMVRANVTVLEKDQARAKAEEAELTSKIKAAIQAGRDDLAANYAIRLDHVKKSLAHGEGQLEVARRSFEKAMNVKRAFMREKERRTREALEAIRAHRRAQWQMKVTDAMEGLEFGSIDQTHDEMLRKIEEKTAMNEARMEMALDSHRLDELGIEEDAERIRAEELVKQLKTEMGLGAGEKRAELPASSPTETVESVEAALGEKAPAKAEQADEAAADEAEAKSS